MGRNRVWKAKDPSFRRLLEEVAAEADVFRAKGQAWRAEGLGDWPLPRVLWRLAELGLPCAKQESFQEAFEIDSVHGLASLWALRLRAEGELREFLEYAAVVVHRWHFSKGDCPEADFLLAADLAIEDECREEKRDKERLLASMEAALRVAKVAPICWPSNPAGWVSMMEERCRVSVSTWAADLVFALGVEDLYDEGIAVAEAWAPLTLTERFRSEVPLLLALSEKDEEARKAIAALQRDFPTSLSALFMAGEALVALQKREEGYRMLERAMALAESREERLWIREHLTNLTTLMDDPRKEPPPAVFEEDEEDLLDVPEPIVAEERVGRNDPCPCGSGKKYKKCCAKGGA